jgi:hypothetical protein
LSERFQADHADRADGNKFSRDRQIQELAASQK